MSAVTGHVVYVTAAHPDKRLHGYVGEITDSRPGSVLVTFRIAIGNTIESAWCTLREIAPLPRA